MSKSTIYLSAGHYLTARGAKNIDLNLNEHTECVRIVKAMISQPQSINFEVIPGGSLFEKVRFVNARANKNKDLTLEIHLNAAISNQCQGMEVLYCQGSIKGQALAGSVLKGMQEYLPFKVRGIKSRNNLYFLKQTIVPAIIPEICFLDNNTEASYLFFQRSHEIIARSICRGIQAFITNKG